MKATRNTLLSSCLLLAAASCRDDSNTGNVDLSAADLSVSGDVDLANSAADMAQSPDMAVAPPSEFMVVRVGDGAATLTSAATVVYVDRFKIADGARVGNAIMMPTSVTGTQRQLTLSGTSDLEGALTRSTNNKYVVLAGYDTAPGTAGVSGSTSSVINRVIGRIAADNTVDTSTAFTAFSSNSIRGAATTDGDQMWAAGANGIIYTPFKGVAASVSLNSLNSRVPLVIGNQLYVTSGSGTNIGVNTVTGANGTPMVAGATVSLLPGFSAQTVLSSYSFAALDRDATPGIDTLYVADDRSTGGGVQRWRLVGTTWTFEGTFSAGATVGARGVAAYQTGTGVVLVASITEAAGLKAKVVSFMDTGQTPSTATAKDLVIAPDKTTYRGLALAPE